MVANAIEIPIDPTHEPAQALTPRSFPPIRWFLKHRLGVPAGGA